MDFKMWLIWTVLILGSLIFFGALLRELFCNLVYGDCSTCDSWPLKALLWHFFLSYTIIAWLPFVFFATLVLDPLYRRCGHDEDGTFGDGI